MIWKILKRDLLKSKGTNILIFTLILASMMLFASAATVLFANTNSIERFKVDAHLTDYLIVTLNDEDDKPVEDFLKNSEYVINYDKESLISISQKDIDFPNVEKMIGDLFLSKIPTQYNLVYNMNDERLKVNEGEIYLPSIYEEKCSLKVGQIIKITIDSVEREFELKGFVKDSCFGTQFMGVKRLFISDSDYEDFEQYSNTYFYDMDIVPGVDFDKEFNKQNLRFVSAVDGSTIEMVFFFDLLTALIVSVISILLIIIAIVTIIFTIKFTIKKETTNIGVLKAIGISNPNIRSIYISKYAAITFVSVLLGFFLSVPISKVLLKNISQTAVINVTFYHYLISLVSTFIAGILIMAVAYLSTNKVCKVKPIAAIRGESTEKNSKIRFNVKNNYHSHTLKRAFIDLVQNPVRSILLLIVFIVSLLTIVVPANVISTLGSDSARTMFSLPEFDFTIRQDDFQMKNVAHVEKTIDDFTLNLDDKGIDVYLYAEITATHTIYAYDKKDAILVYCRKLIGQSAEAFEYSTGRAPKYKNEVALGNKTVESLNVKLGDTIHIPDNKKGEDREFVLVGTYDTMMNMGQGLTFSDDYEFIDTICQSKLYGIIKNKKTIEDVKNSLPDELIRSTNDILNEMLGSVRNSFGLIKTGVIFLVSVIVFVVVSLLSRLILDKEYKDYALEKSIGIPSKAIYKYNLYRLLILGIITVIITDLISYGVTKVISDSVFNIMGATAPKYDIDILGSYIIYPLIVCCFIFLGGITTFNSIRKIKAIEVKE